MDFKTAVTTCLKLKYMDFTGRAVRSEYWYYTLFAVIVGIVAGIIDTALGLRLGEAGTVGIIGTVLNVAMLLPGLGVSVRRLHDGNRSGWWLLVAFVPIVGAFLLIYWFVQRGTVGSNNFGPDPLEDLAKPFA